MVRFEKDQQFARFCAYGFLKNLRLFDIFLLLFLVELELTFTQIGVLYAVREIIVNVLEIPSGILADTYGRKTSLLASFLAYMGSFVIFYMAESFWWLFAAMVVFGMADAFRSGTHKAMIMDYLAIKGWKDQKVAYYGHTRSWSQMGSALSALAGAAVYIMDGDMRAVFIWSVVPYLLNFINVLSYPNAINRPQKVKKRPRPGETVKAFWTVIRRPALLHILHSSAVHSAYTKALKDYLQFFVFYLVLNFANNGLLDWYSDGLISTETTLGVHLALVYFVIFLLSAAASRNAGRLEKITGIDLPLLTLLGGLSLGALSGWMADMGEMWLAVCLLGAVFVVENLRKPLLTGMVADGTPPELLASVLSAQSFWKTVLTAGLAITYGFLADRITIDMALIWLSLGLVAVTVVLWIVGRIVGKPTN